MIHGGSGQDPFLAEINVTPFVDVMLVLLIIFMVTAPMMIQGVNVALPETISAPMEAEDDQLVVTVDAHGKIFINDASVTLEFLKEKLSAILKTRASRNVFLKADKSVSYGSVIQVMAAVKRAGVAKLGMITEPLDEERRQ
ncbi:MAG: protein TolR [Deltaproteobacteria bacterium]|nr:MAG: protein TolR [Deltaproteobacteria bacterium]